jgi:hypothetical protein
VAGAGKWLAPAFCWSFWPDWPFATERLVLVLVLELVVEGQGEVEVVNGSGYDRGRVALGVWLRFWACGVRMRTLGEQTRRVLLICSSFIRLLIDDYCIV